MISIFWTLGCILFGISIGILLPDLIRHFQKPIVLRIIPKDEAREMILNYIKNNDGAWTSDIFFDLRLSVDLVLDILDELKQEGSIEARTLCSSHE